MPVQLVAERFVETLRGCWFDLATGSRVWLRTAELEEDSIRVWQQRCEAEFADRDQGAAALIDFGVAGLRTCFEAREMNTGGGTRRTAPTGTLIVRQRGETTSKCFVARVIAAATAERHQGVHVVRFRPPDMDAGELCSLAARSLRPHGYVTVYAGVDLSEPIVSALCHLHVVIFCFTTTDRMRAAGWVQRLGTTSPRAHLVVDVSGEEPAEPSGLFVRERAPAFGVGSSLPRYLQRAAAFERRGRLAATTRYLRAAVVTAQREANATAQIETARRLIELLSRRGEFSTACRVAWQLARDVRKWPERTDAVAVAAHTLMLSTRVVEADMLLTTLAAECSLRRWQLPPAAAICAAELSFWQGQYERAGSLIDRQSGSGLELLKWQGLVAWAVGDRETLRQISTSLASQTDQRARVWHRGFDLLLDPSVSTSTVVDVATELSARASEDPLLHAIGLELLVSRGLCEHASRLVQLSGTSRQATSPLLKLVIDRLAGESGIRRDSRGPADRDAQRLGLHGLLRWGLRREGMHLVQSVPRLLQIVTDAEDEHAVLTATCKWIDEHAGMSAVSIIGAEDGRVIAGAGVEKLELDTSDLNDVIRSPHARAIVQSHHAVVIAPIRYGGRTIAAVVARGAIDVVSSIKEAVETAAPLCAPAVRARLDALALAASRHTSTPEILGCSPALAAVREGIARVAATAFPVLIEGESGTGKELVARAVHRLGGRRDRRFCAVNCAALTDELVEAELFGYARGAFTGAVTARPGLFEEAHQGTLFLDEIRELSARAQAKLLRALQEREIRRVGENAPRAVDVRIIAATNQPLGQAASQGDFREDLVFRLAVVRLRLPPLRERVEDVPLLAQAFWRQLTLQTGTRARLGPDAFAALSRHAWPGNVRELQNAIAALVVLAPHRGRVGSRLVRQVLDGAAAGESSAVSLDAARRAVERQTIASALARHGGRRIAAARELGLTRQGLLKAMKRVGLDADPGRAGVA